MWDRCHAEHEHTVATHPCEWAHEGETCSYSAAKFFPGAYLRALPVYLPVYVLPAILVHRSTSLQLLDKSALHGMGSAVDQRACRNLQEGSSFFWKEIPVADI